MPESIMSRSIRPVGLVGRRSSQAARSDAPNPAASPPPGSQASSIAAYTTITGSSIPAATSGFVRSGCV
jgi:hypothetical protein